MERKIAFVTGASNVTGKAIAIAFAKAGYDVGFTYTSNEEGAKKTLAEIEAVGAKGKYYYMDTSDIETSMATLDEFCNEFGPLDVMINNTGITETRKFLDVTPATYDRLLKINVSGTLFMMQKAAKIMIAGNKKGSIINISSVHAKTSFIGHIEYASTKAAICRFTQTAALELAPYGIRVNAFAPGHVNMSSSPKFADPEKQADLQKTYSDMAEYFPTGNWQDPNVEIAEAVVQMTTPAFRFMVGQTIFADGGVTLPCAAEPNWNKLVDPDFHF